MKYPKNLTTGSVVNPVLQLVVFILAIGLLGLLGYRQLDRVLTPRRTVAVLSKALKAGEQLSAEHLTMTNLRSKHLSDAVLDDPGVAIGRILARNKREGEPIYPSDLARSSVGPKTPLAELVPEGRVITTMMLTNLTIPYRELKGGDRVDILAAGSSTRGQRSSSVIVRDAYVLGYLAPPVTRSEPRRGLLGIMSSAEKKKKTPPGLMLAVFPQDVLPLAEIDGTGVHVKLALHNSKTVKEDNMLRVERVPQSRTIDVIAGDKRESVEVAQ
jgi:Flp pilus assembly protein CpaB